MQRSELAVVAEEIEASPEADAPIGRRAEPWVAIIEQFDESTAIRDPRALLDSFVGLIPEYLPHIGVLLEIDEPAGARLAAHRGLSAELVENLALDRVDGQLPGPVGPPVSVSGVESTPGIEGTFLLDGLRRAQVDGIVTMPVRIANEFPRGVLRLLVPEGAEIGGRELRFTRIFLKRLLLTLEHLWMSSQAEWAEARLQTIVDGAYDAIVTFGCDCRVESANRAASRLFGFSEREMAGRLIDIMIAPHERERTKALFTRMAPGLGRATISAVHEIEGRRKDGSLVFVDLSVNEIDGGRGFAVIMRDVTARKAAEARMLDADRLAVIGTLAAGLGHDMNNVLFPIRAHLNALSSNGKPIPKAKRELHFAEIRSSVSYLQHLADSLHCLALDPDGDGDGLGCTELGSWWSQSGPLLAKSLHRVSDIEVSIEPGVRPVNVPPHSLTRAVLNLLVNAGEAMPKGRVPSASKVCLRVRSGNGGAVLEVSDNGVGMTAEVVRRAFDMFFTTKTRGLGTGLGLPLVRRVVERAGGRIEIDSKPGVGTTIRLHLPFVEEAEDAPRLVAALRLVDGRAAAIIRGLLGMYGVEVCDEVAADDADVLIADAPSTTLQDAERWTSVHPPRQLILVGVPLAAVGARFEQLGLTVIRDPMDLQAIERGLDAALQLQIKEC